MNIWKKALSVGLSLALCAGLVMPALAVTYDISKGDVIINDGGSSGWLVGEDKPSESTERNVTITQTDSTPTEHTIKVAEGATAAITLSGVNIEAGNGQSALETGKGSNVTIELDGENKLTGGENKAGLSVGESAKVTIQDESGSAGSLTAQGGFYGAGIGAGYGSTAGDITITGGNVTAKGGNQASGIGSGSESQLNGKVASSVGSITISGGQVHAEGGAYGAGIGSGERSSFDAININGSADVTAKGGYGAAGIGSGFVDKNENGTISIGGSAKVTATGGDGGGAGIGNGQGGTVKSIDIGGSTNVTATGGSSAAGIGSGVGSMVQTINISGSANVTATGGSSSAAIGAGWTGAFGAINITTSGDIVATSGRNASAIGYGDQPNTSSKGTIAIQGVNSLVALGDGQFAIDVLRADVTGVKQEILNGRFVEGLGGLTGVEEITFKIVDAQGKTVKTFTLKPRISTNMYESFAVNLPEGTYYVLPANEKTYDGSIVGYTNKYQGKKVFYAISEDTMLNADKMQFPSFDVKYSFASDDDAVELPEAVTSRLPADKTGQKLTKLEFGEVTSNLTFDDVKTETGTWHFGGWSSDRIIKDGIVGDVELVGTWTFTPASTDDDDPATDPTGPNVFPDYDFGYGETTTIEDEAVPLAGLFTRADAIGYLWQQSGEPEAELSTFEDVPEDHQWAVAIGWAQDVGIAVADQEGNFRPDDLVLRWVEDHEAEPEGEFEEFLNRYAEFAGIELDADELFVELGGEPEDIIMGEDAQVIFDDFFAKLEQALEELAA